MKKTLIAFAALSAIAGMAQAQSTVTIYGLLDGNFGTIKSTTANSGTTATRVDPLTQTVINSGGLNGSRWGIRVSEDLGGGLAAVGNLESGFNLDTGGSAQGGLLFGRRANVGLSGGFGTVVIGRNSSSYDDVSADHAMMEQSPYDPSNTNNGNSAAAAASVFNAFNGLTNAAIGTNLAAANGTNANALANATSFLNRNTTWIGFNTRFNNSVKYTSPSFSGFVVSGMYGFGEDKTITQNASSVVSLSARYSNGPILVSGGYQSENLAVTAANGAKPALVNTLLNFSYDFGVAKVGLGINRAKYRDLTIAADGVRPAGTVFDSAAQQEYSLSVAVPVGATTFSAGYAQSKGNDFGKSSGFGVQALYSLSKRTTLYGGFSTTKAYDGLANAVTAALATTAAGAGSSVGKVNVASVGIRHKF